jgi:hypothetical protein
LGIIREHIEADRRRLASISFKSLFEQFLASKEEKKRDREYLKELRICFNRSAPIHDKLVCDVTHDDVEKILAAYGGKDAHMRYLRAVFNFAIKKKKLLTENPISSMDFSEPQETEVEIIPIAEVEKLLLGALQSDLELLLQSGHDPDTLYKHYYKAITDKEAEKFWSIFPPKQEGKIVAFPAA